MTSMNIQKPSKLNFLLQEWPKGTVAVQPWLNTHGISRQLVDSYRRHNWLERIGVGAYIRVGDNVGWQGAIFALQHGYGYQFHLAAKTALTCQGLSHYLPMGPMQNIELMKSSSESHVLPKWIDKFFKDKNQFILYERNLFDNEQHGLTKVYDAQIPMIVSSPERAIMECFSLAPKYGSLSSCYSLLEGMSSLRPKLVQSLLEECRSVKVKRLFMLFSEVLNHKWHGRLNKNKMNFGSGKRVIGEGGYYYSEYQLSMPFDLNTYEGYKNNE